MPISALSLPNEGISPNQIKRWSLDAGDWLWGTVKGCFNEKMTTSQIIVDAVIGIIPVVGDVTAVRDLIAVTLHLVNHPEKRKEVMEWVLLVILLLALIPVAGGVLKGVGRLVSRGAKTAAESRGLLKEVITFLNRMGTGNAVKFIKELNLLKYERQVVRSFFEVVDHMTLALEKIETKLAWFIPNAIKERIPVLKTGLKELRDLGDRMIPKAVKDLHEKLKVVQQAIYEGEWHALQSGGKQVTREAEARLLEGRIASNTTRKMKFPQNAAGEKQRNEIAKVYTHKPGWPDLLKYKEVEARTQMEFFRDIEAFSGKIEGKVIRGPYEMTRYFDSLKAGPSGAWWFPNSIHIRDAKSWREEGAVLDSFNKDGFKTTCHVPAGVELHAWEGVVAGQVDHATGQFLEGGGKQMVVDLGIDGATYAAIRKAAESGVSEFKASNGLIFKFEKTGWKDSVGIHGFGAEVEKHYVKTEALAKSERQSKLALAGARVAHGTNQTSKGKGN